MWLGIKVVEAETVMQFKIAIGQYFKDTMGVEYRPEVFLPRYRNQ